VRNGIFCLATFIVAISVTAAETEIKITLFGQPCVLKGPQDERTLQKVHSISPEQLEPPISVESARKQLERVRSATQLPSLLDSYRERQAKRLEAQVSYFEALEDAKKLGKPAPLMAVGKKYLKNQKPRRVYEDAVRKAKTLQDRELSVRLLDLFNEGIEADPQEDFHRAAKKLGITYTCSFEEDSASPSDGAPSSEEKR
jgi:hypothetical protein